MDIVVFEQLIVDYAGLAGIYSFTRLLVPAVISMIPHGR